MTENITLEKDVEKRLTDRFIEKKVTNHLSYGKKTYIRKNGTIVAHQDLLNNRLGHSFVNLSLLGLNTKHMIKAVCFGEGMDSSRSLPNSDFPLGPITRKNGAATLFLLSTAQRSGQKR